MAISYIASVLGFNSRFWGEIAVINHHLCDVDATVATKRHVRCAYVMVSLVIMCVQNSANAVGAAALVDAFCGFN
jgi:hypothetical protein